MSTEEHVVLVTGENEVVGTAPKATVHTDATPLHRGFSLFLFRTNGDLLLQQRALSKKTWPGVWSNSCCGHPALDESPLEAAERRLRDELGITNVTVTMMLPDYRYRAERDGVVENELCPVMVALSDEPVVRNPDEVEATEWIGWDQFLGRIASQPGFFSPWCEEEARLLQDVPDFQAFLSQFSA